MTPCNKIFVVVLCAINIIGCTITPLAYDNGSLYLGAFKAEKEKDENCKYSEIEGIGINIGVTHISTGIGYFKRKMLSVVPGKDVYCKSEIADVYIGNIAEEKSVDFMENELIGR
jgi:hypothetical protein